MARSFKQRGTVVVPLAESPIPMVEVESIDNPAIFSETIAGEGNITGLTVYGKSTQDGTPSPENPVPIVSAGDGGSIGLTVSDGADQSQSLTISTPNGLPGIPVNSGGNYTDASGQQLVCNEIDYAREVYVQRCALEKVVGTPNFIETADRPGRYAWANVLANTYGTGSAKILSTFGKWLNWGTGNEIGAAINGTSILFNYLKSNAANEVNDIFSNLIEANQCYVLGQLAAPIEKPISPEELTAYRALHTYDGTTVISANSDPIAPGVKTTVKVIDPNSGNPQIMQLWLDEEGHPVNINGRGARVGGTPTQQYILQPCSF